MACLLFARIILFRSCSWNASVRKRERIYQFYSVVLNIIQYAQNGYRTFQTNENMWKFSDKHIDYIATSLHGLDSSLYHLYFRSAFVVVVVFKMKCAMSLWGERAHGLRSVKAAAHCHCHWNFAKTNYLDNNCSSFENISHFAFIAFKFLLLFFCFDERKILASFVKSTFHSFALHCNKKPFTAWYQDVYMYIQETRWVQLPCCSCVQFNAFQALSLSLFLFFCCSCMSVSVSVSMPYVIHQCKPFL